MSDPDPDPTHRSDRTDRPSYLIRGLIALMIVVVVAAPLVGMRSLLFSMGEPAGPPRTAVADTRLSPSADGDGAGDGQLVAMPSTTPSRSHSPSPSASPSRSGHPHRSPSATPSASPSGGAHTSRAGLTADYSTTSSWSSGFVGEVEVGNDGNRSAGWTVVITLPYGATVTDVWGDADAEQDGRTVTFTPADGSLPPGSTTSFDFQVHGASGPSGCSVDGNACG